MASDIRLLPLSEGTVDRQTLFALYELSLYQYVDQTFGWNDDFQRERFDTSYRDTEFSLIALGLTTVGYVVLRNEGDSLHLSLLLLWPEYQHQGIGRQVMRTLIAQATEMTLPLTLSCFLANRGAINFYRQLGFVATTQDEYFATYRFQPVG